MELGRVDGRVDVRRIAFLLWVPGWIHFAMFGRSHAADEEELSYAYHGDTNTFAWAEPRYGLAHVDFMQAAHKKEGGKTIYKVSSPHSLSKQGKPSSTCSHANHSTVRDP